MSVLGVGAVAALLCCTSVNVPTDSGPCIARTVERPMSWMYKTTATWRPAQTRESGIGSEWIVQHSYLTLGVWAAEGRGGSNSTQVTMEGHNEHGLIVEALTHKMAEYSPHRAEAHSQLSYLDLASYLLATAKDVGDAKHALASINVTDVPRDLKALKSLFFGLHWVVADPHGMWTLEFSGGKPVWTRNDLGVLTNDPSYQWHVYNLNNYVALSDSLPKNIVQVGSVPGTPSMGPNLLGMPGDGSPPSRFVRSFYMREFALQGRQNVSFEEAVILGTELLNTVQVVQGSVKVERELESADFEMTVWSVISVPGTRQLYYRTFKDMGWRLVDIAALKVADRPFSFPLITPSTGLGIVNVTGSFSSAGHP